jgi:hypothetical protein
MLRKALVAARKREMANNGDRPMTENQIVQLCNTVVKPPIDGVMIKSGVQQVISYMAPVKALAKQHAWMRRYCRKPHDMTTNVYVNHLFRVNKEELPRLPPKFDDTQKLSEDDIVDLHGVPKKWTREFERTGFGPYEETLEALIKQCKRMESLDSMDAKQTSRKTDTKDSGKTKKSLNKFKQSHGKCTGDCVIHGQGGGHSTDKCKVILGMVDPKKRSDKKISFKKDYKKNDKKGDDKNKAWSCKSDEAKDKTKKDLAAFIGKMVKKEMNSIQKKGSRQRKCQVGQRL